MERLVGDHRKASSLRLLKLKFYLGLAPLVFGAFWRVLVFPTFFPDRRKATGSQIIISNKPQAQSHLDFVGVLHLEHTLEHKGQTRQNRRVATMRRQQDVAAVLPVLEAVKRAPRGEDARRARCRTPTSGVVPVGRNYRLPPAVRCGEDTDSKWHLGLANSS